MLVGVISYKVIREMQKGLGPALTCLDIFTGKGAVGGGGGGATTVDAMNFDPVALCGM